MRNGAQRFAGVATILLLAVAGCGGDGGGGGNQVSGYLVLSAVNGATVEAYEILDTGAIGPSPLGTATTGADGSFTVGVGSYTGPVLLMATGGSYVDEATGATMTIADEDPLFGMAIAVSGTANGNVTPLTHWATMIAYALSTEPNTDALLAIDNAVLMVEDYFGVTDLLTTVPADLTAGTVAPGNAAEHGAAIAGMSQLADDYAYSDPVVLVHDLASDGTDGRFDGEERGTETLPDWDMASLQLRDAIRFFLNSNARIQSGLSDGNVGVDEAVEARVVPGSYSSYAWPPLITAMDVSGGTSAGNTTVQFTGEFINTTSGVDVYFGGVQGTPVSSGPTSVTVRTPSGVAGTVDVDIVNLELGLTTRIERRPETRLESRDAPSARLPPGSWECLTVRRQVRLHFCPRALRPIGRSGGARFQPQVCHCHL